MKKEDLAEIIRLHGMWLSGEVGGTRATLTDATLRGATLRGATLTDATLRGATLTGATLTGATLRGADLRDATLTGADLTRATLRGATLTGATLTGATLRGADLRDADLRDATLTGADLTRATLTGAVGLDSLTVSRLSIVPESGPFHGWKKCERGVLVRVEIPAESRRSNSTGRKCRAEFVRVLEVIGADCGISQHDGKTEYRAGETVRCDSWCEDRWQECAGGIHFFITRAEADAY